MTDLRSQVDRADAELRKSHAELVSALRFTKAVIGHPDDMLMKSIVDVVLTNAEKAM